MKKLAIVIVAYAALGSSAYAMERMCTQIGCSDGLTLQIAPEYRWQAGAYRFMLKLDGEEVVCQGSLPLKNCGEPNIICSQPDKVQMGESGCALAPNLHGFGDIFMSFAPKDVTVAIARDGKEMLSQHLTPTYITSQPNGEGCDPVCTQAHVPLALKP
jgi:hypothetical protein